MTRDDGRLTVLRLPEFGLGRGSTGRRVQVRGPLGDCGSGGYELLMCGPDRSCRRRGP